ncbi:MAG: TetR family transcriptional regulator C-terminal domain-containing protein [Edaphobacter sp.]
MALEALKYYACIADQVFVPPETAETAAESGKDSPSDIERIRNQFIQASRFQEGPNGSLGCLMGNFAAESDNLPASFRKFINQSFKRWDASIAASLTRAQKKGEIDSSHDPEELARYLMASWQGALLLMKNSKSRVPIDDFFHFTLDVLMRADATKAAGVKRKLQRPRKKA